MIRRKEVIYLGFFICLFSFYTSAQYPWRVPYKDGNLWGLADTNGRVILTPQFEDVDFSYFGFSRFKQNGLFGFLDSLGNIAIPAKFKKAGNFNIDRHTRTAFVTDQNNREYDIMPDGRPAGTSKEIHPSLPGEKLLLVDPNVIKSVQKKFKGVYDSVGYARYMNSDLTSYEYYKIYKKKKVGLMDKNFNIKIKPQYDALEFIYQDFIIVKSGKNYLIIDQNNQRKYHNSLDSILFTPTYSWIQIREKGKWGAITFDFKSLIKPEYDHIYSSMNAAELPFFKIEKTGFTAWDDVIIIEKNGKKGIYNMARNYKIEPIYNDIVYYISYYPGMMVGKPSFTNRFHLYYMKLDNGEEGYIDRTGTKRFFK
jgi:WG containing repeat